MIVVFGEIQRSGLAGNALAGIVFKFAALARVLHDAALDAEILILVQLGAVGTVGAGAGHFLSEQHVHDLTVCDLRLLYTKNLRNATLIF